MIIGGASVRQLGRSVKPSDGATAVPWTAGDLDQGAGMGDTDAPPNSSLV
jgi:hypothetical protein